MVGVVSCPLLVASLGFNGAALATVLSIAVINVLASWVLLVRFHIWPWDSHIFVTVCCFTASLACARGLESVTSLSNVTRCLVTATVIVVLTLGGALTTVEWPELQGFTRPRPGG